MSVSPRKLPVIVADILVCDACLFANVNGEDITSPGDPVPWSTLGDWPGAHVSPNCADCDSEDSHAFRYRADCDGCGAEVNTLHGYAIMSIR